MDDWIFRALEERPEERHSDAREMARELEALSASDEPSTDARTTSATAPPTPPTPKPQTASPPPPPPQSEPNRPASRKIIGIDLGATHSRVAVFENGAPLVIANAAGQRSIPSVVAIDKDRNALVGSEALGQAVMNPNGTVFSVGRFMARP